MQVEQAVRALGQLQAAAPPATSARLGEMIALIRVLEAENASLKQQIRVLSAKTSTGALEAENVSLKQQILALSAKASTRELEAENASLKQQIKALSVKTATGTLPTQVFDSLRPSMTIIRGHVDGLIQGKFGSVTTEQAESIKLIGEHASSALGLMDSLDMIDKLRKGQLQLETNTFSGLDLLATVWQHEAAAAEPREHQINIRADNPLPPVKGDYKHVLNILTGLVDNAIHYTPFGGVIRVTAETLGTHVLFTVADNGIGLSEEDTENIGRPFWRAARQPLVRQHPGTGLRLYLARQVLKMHGSDLFLSGEPGVGSSFSFLLATG